MPHVYETISDQVPHHYETIPGISSDLPHHYETINDSGIYSKGKPTDLMKYNWYHGNISEEQAEVAISYGESNTFFVRHTENKLILSYKIRGWKSHDIIHRSPKGYHLEGKEKVFKTVPEMIDHYKQFPICGDQVLGTVVDHRALSGTSILLYCIILLKHNAELKINSTTVDVFQKVWPSCLVQSL